MIKLTLGLVGVTLSTLGAFLLLKSQTSQRSSSGYSSARVTSTIQGKPDLTLINDIKEIFGLPPIGSQSSLFSGKFGAGGGTGGGPEAVGYLPPKSSFRADGSGETSLGVSESTTPFFRIIITPKSRPSTPETTPSASGRSEESTFESTPSSFEEQDKNSSSVTSTSTTTAPEDIQIDVRFNEMEEAQTTTSPKSESVDVPRTTLEPPSANSAPNSALSAGTGSGNSTENEVKMEKDAASRGRSDQGPSNGLYLPPNKEYLPPRS